jgi:hypothetical protein
MALYVLNYYFSGKNTKITRTKIVRRPKKYTPEFPVLSMSFLTSVICQGITFNSHTTFSVKRVVANGGRLTLCKLRQIFQSTKTFSFA